MTIHNNKVDLARGDCMNVVRIEANLGPNEDRRSNLARTDGWFDIQTVNGYEWFK